MEAKKGRLVRLLKEPLLHFLVLGAALFVVYGLTSKSGDGSAPEKIVVTAGQVESLSAGFAKTWLRPPTGPELKELIDDWVREEIATREAMSLGLDKGDAVIRRRLRQKLEFASDDMAALAEPTDAELSAYLQAHAESFRVAPEGRLPDLAEVRDAVLREWANARRVEANEKLYRELLQRYTVIVEVALP